MSEAISYTERMTSSFAGVNTEAKYTIDNAKAKITIIDNEKIAFDESLKNIDQDLLTTIEETNDTLKEVKKQYDLRITDQGCRTDLFWRVTGIGTFNQTQNVGGGAGSISTSTQLQLTCTRLSVTYPKVANGFDAPTICDPNWQPTPEELVQPPCITLPTSWTDYNPDAMMYYTGGGSAFGQPNIEVVDMGDGDTLNSDGSAFDAYLLPDNLHGMKLYREPFDRDVFDLSVFSGIGTIAPGSNDIYLLTTNINNGIEVGNLVTTVGGNTPFAGSSGNIVTGIGSTAKDLSGFSDIVNVATGSTISIIPVITVADAATGEAPAPNKDGEYTTFDFSKDPNKISDNYALSVSDSPYVPQEISIQDFSEKGAGVKIKYDNSGVPNSKQDWNKFLEGFPDPEQLPDNIVEVKEPKVGAGKIYYVIGFPDKPVMPGGGDASEGDVVVIQEPVAGNWPSLYQSLPSCDNGDLNDAISKRDDAEAELSGDNDFPEKISLANKIRKKRDELNIAIWAYRTHIGDSEDRIQNNDEFANTILESDFQDLMNGTD